jgi:hypothetical protein
LALALHKRSEPEVLIVFIYARLYETAHNKLDSVLAVMVLKKSFEKLGAGDLSTI